MTMCCTSHALMVRIRLGVAISCAHTIIELAHMKHLFFYMKKAFLFKFLCEAYVNSVLASNIYIYIYLHLPHSFTPCRFDSIVISQGTMHPKHVTFESNNFILSVLHVAINDHLK
jgi:hypothetical protein